LPRPLIPSEAVAYEARLQRSGAGNTHRLRRRFRCRRNAIGSVAWP